MPTPVVPSLRVDSWKVWKAEGDSTESTRMSLYKTCTTHSLSVEGFALQTATGQQWRSIPYFLQCVMDVLHSDWVQCIEWVHGFEAQMGSNFAE